MDSSSAQSDCSEHVVKDTSTLLAKEGALGTNDQTIGMVEPMFTQCGSYNNYVVFFCIGKECKEHRIVRFTREGLCKLLDKSERLVSRPGERSIGTFVRCKKCVDKDFGSGTAELVETGVLDVVEVALGHDVLFYSHGFASPPGRKSRTYLLNNPTLTCCLHRELFTGSVQQVDLATRELVEADLDSFFCFAQEPTMRDLADRFSRDDLDERFALVVAKLKEAGVFEYVDARVVEAVSSVGC